jgi:hypothetical protein
VRKCVTKSGEKRAEKPGQDDAAAMKIVGANQDSEYVQRRYGELKCRQRVYEKNACSNCDGKGKGVWARGMEHVQASL